MKYKILSIDGGGRNGVIPAAICTRIEKETKQPIYKLFDMIAGTSTGGILSASFAIGLPAQDVLQMYKSDAKTIFSKNKFNPLGLFKPTYSHSGMNSIFSIHFLDYTIKQVNQNVDLMLTAYDLQSGKLKIFKSYDETQADFYLHDLVQATCSAPTYFPSFKLNDYNLIDGGVGPNNPTMCAVADAIKMGYSLDDIVVISLGCGQYSKYYSNFDTRNWGVLKWLRHKKSSPLISTTLIANNQAVDYQTKQLVPNYIRINPIRPDYTMDEVSDEAYYELLKVANQININSILNKIYE